MNLRRFFAELQRRHVYKVGAAYLVVDSLAVQAISIGFPAFDHRLEAQTEPECV